MDCFNVTARGLGGRSALEWDMSSQAAPSALLWKRETQGKSSGFNVGTEPQHRHEGLECKF